MPNRDLPRWLKEQIDPDVWDDEEFSDNYLLYSYYCTEGLFECPEANPKEFVTTIITMNPGIWTAKLCRIKHDIPETKQSISFCGLCEQYANPRKRERGRRMALTGLLPGFEQGQYEIHPPCSRKALTWLRHTLKRMVRDEELTEQRMMEIVDLCQERGYDYATGYWRKKECVTTVVNIEQ